jgi:hypothetical protein
MDRPASFETGRSRRLSTEPARNDPKGKKMIRNLKALGLALVALFAMSAVAASVASAETPGVITSDLNKTAVTLKGTDTGGETVVEGEKVFDNSFTVTVLGNTIKLRCPESHYTGHKALTEAETKEEKKHQPLTVGETKITVVPTYTNCTDGTNVINVAMNGCDYDFYDATTTGGIAGTYGVTVDIVCPEGKKIEITGGVCTVKVGPQAGLKGFHLTNTPAGATTKDDVDITGTVTVKATACGIAVEPIYHADVTMKGYNSLGGEIGVTVSDQ